jgi:hypothetical protein
MRGGAVGARLVSLRSAALRHARGSAILCRMSASKPFLRAPGGRAGRLLGATLTVLLGMAAADAALADLPSPPKPKPRPTAAAAAGDAGPAPDDAGVDAGQSAPPMNPEEQRAQLDDLRAKATRIARAKGQRQLLRKRVEELMRGRGMDPALKQELLRHAKRVARLERARAVAEDKKDAEQAARAEELLKRETARHDGWVAAFAAKEPGK